MVQKTMDIQYMWFLILSSFSVVILYPAGQRFFYWFPLIFVFPILLSGRSSFIRTRYFPICLSVVIILAFAVAKIKNAAVLSFGVPQQCINSLTGYVVYDSSFTQAGNHLMTIYATEVGTTYGQTVGAKGLITVIGNERAVITGGIKITLYGKLSGEFFKYNSLQVLTKSKINTVREYIIAEIEKRVLGTNPGDATILSTMLILGRADETSSIKDAAKACGCSHVLALSGMHLSLLGSVFKPIKNKKIKYAATVLISSAFVFIAGPRPSLVRALLMLIFSFLPTTEKLVVCFTVQLVVFPFSMINIGCVYSYLAIFAIVFLTPHFDSKLATTPCVLLMIAPVNLFTNGTWHPLAMIAGPIAAIMISLCMALGFLIAIFGHLPLLLNANNFMFSALNKLFEIFRQTDPCGWKSYIVFAVVMAVVFIIRQRFKKYFKRTIMKI